MNGSACRRIAWLVCALMALPRVHPDRIARHRADRLPRASGVAWITGWLPRHVKPSSADVMTKRNALAVASTRFPSRCAGMGLSHTILELGVSDDGGIGPHERTKTMDWVNEKTRGGGGLDLEKIFEQGDSSSHQRPNMGYDIQSSPIRRSGERENDFKSIMDRCNQRLDKYLHNGGGPESAIAKKEMSRAFHLIDEQTTVEPNDDFDIIIERSRQRIDVAAQRVELRSKREQMAQLQKSLLKRKQEAEVYAAEVHHIELALKDAQMLGAARSRIQDLEDALRAAQVRLRGLEHVVKALAEEVESFLAGLRDTEAQLEAHRIRNELVLERQRQMMKLQNLLFDMGSKPLQSLQAPLADATVVSLISQAKPGSPADQFNAVANGMETLADVRQHLTLMQRHLGDADEQVHTKFQEFLWKRVGLNKNKAAIAAAAMPIAGEFAIEGLEATVTWLEENVLVSSERLLTAVEARPSILLLNVKENLEPALEFLTKKLQLDKRGVVSVITACPALLEADAERELGPRLALLREETGVAANKAGKLVQMHPHVLSESGLLRLQPHLDFFRTEVGVSKASMGKILAALPGLTGMSIQGQLRPTHQWLLKIGVPRTRIERMLVQHPKTLGYSLDNNLKPTVDWLWSEIGVRDDKIGRIVGAFPQILGLSVDSNLKPTVAFLVDEVGVPTDKLAKIFSSFPQLFGLSLDNTIRPRVAFLTNEVGVPHDKMAKVIFSFPNLLAYNHLENLRPTVSFLHDDVGIPTERMGKMVATHPQILGYSIEDKLLPTMRYLVEEVGVPEESMGSVVERCPKLLGCSVDRNLRPTVRFLIEEVGMSQSEVGQMVMRYPSLLGLSIDNNLRPKLHYLVDQVKIDQDVIRNQLKTCPQLLAYSLEQRIKPRHRLLHGKGLKLGLHSMLSPTDLAFYQRYGGGLSRVAHLQAEKPPAEPPASAPVYYWHQASKEGGSTTLLKEKGSRSGPAVSKKSKTATGAKKKQKAAPRPAKRRVTSAAKTTRSSRSAAGGGADSQEGAPARALA